MQSLLYDAFAAATDAGAERAKLFNVENDLKKIQYGGTFLVEN